MEERDEKTEEKSESVAKKAARKEHRKEEALTDDAPEKEPKGAESVPAKEESPVIAKGSIASAAPEPDEPPDEPANSPDDTSSGDAPKDDMPLTHKELNITPASARTADTPAPSEPAKPAETPAPEAMPAAAPEPQEVVAKPPLISPPGMVEAPKPKKKVGFGTLFFRDKPMFGIDIGSSNVKVMQIDHRRGKCTVTAYGSCDFDPAIISDGVIVEPARLADTIRTLITKKVRGTIVTKRVGLTVPSTRCFIRSMTVPAVALKDLMSAVQLEVEQYIPVPLKELYLDYEIISRTDTELSLLVVAVPKRILDSYIELAKTLELEAVVIEPTITANARLFSKLEQTNVPTILIDFGSNSSDVIVFDKTLVTASMVAGGGETFTELMAQQLGVEHHEAHFIKTKYGLSKSITQQDTLNALSPALEELQQEIKRILRYYSERVNNQRQIQQIIIMGGGANMPGLSDYLTNSLRLPTRMFTPWQKIDFNDKEPHAQAEKHIYATVIGLALLDPKELFA